MPAKQRFELLDNVFIDDRYDVFDRSYLLAAMADVVVARYTSLCDQCLAAGIPVLIHEPLPNGGRLISAWHDYKPFPVLTFSFQELQEQMGDAYPFQGIDVGDECSLFVVDWNGDGLLDLFSGMFEA